MACVQVMQGEAQLEELKKRLEVAETALGMVLTSAHTVEEKEKVQEQEGDGDVAEVDTHSSGDLQFFIIVNIISIFVSHVNFVMYHPWCSFSKLIQCKRCCTIWLQKH